MELRFIAFALTLLLLIPGSVLSEEATRQSKVRAVQRAVLQQQAAERAQRCRDMVIGIQATDADAPAVLNAAEVPPFGTAASGAVVNVGEASLQNECGG